MRKGLLDCSSQISASFAGERVVVSVCSLLKASCTCQDCQRGSTCTHIDGPADGVLRRCDVWPVWLCCGTAALPPPWHHARDGGSARQCAGVVAPVREPALSAALPLAGKLASLHGENQNWIRAGFWTQNDVLRGRRVCGRRSIQQLLRDRAEAARAVYADGVVR